MENKDISVLITHTHTHTCDARNSFVNIHCKLHEINNVVPSRRIPGGRVKKLEEVFIIFPVVGVFAVVSVVIFVIVSVVVFAVVSVVVFEVISVVVFVFIAFLASEPKCVANVAIWEIMRFKSIMDRVQPMVSPSYEDAQIIIVLAMVMIIVITIKLKGKIRNIKKTIMKIMMRLIVILTVLLMTIMIIIRLIESLY